MVYGFGVIGKNGFGVIGKISERLNLRRHITLKIIYEQVYETSNS